MRINQLADEAKRIVGIDGWEPWSFRKIENGILCKGAVCPLITRGPNQGSPNFRKRDRRTVRLVLVPLRSDKNLESSDARSDYDRGFSDGSESYGATSYSDACNDLEDWRAERNNAGREFLPGEGSLIESMREVFERFNQLEDDRAELTELLKLVLGDLKKFIFNSQWQKSDFPVVSQAEEAIAKCEEVGNG